MSTATRTTETRTTGARGAQAGGIRISGTPWLLGAALLALLTIAPINAHAFDACPADQEIEVLWNGTWYPARFTEGPNAQGQCRITYPGWASSWDEWVAEDRVRQGATRGFSVCPAEQAIEVLWNGTWYPARFIEGPNAQAQCKITYPGWESSWDEWVGRDRVRYVRPAQ